MIEHWPEVTITPQGYEAHCHRCGRREQVVLFDRSRGFARQLAAMVDGTAWPPKLKPPIVGRCNTCGGAYHCSLFGYPDEVN